MLKMCQIPHVPRRLGPMSPCLTYHVNHCMIDQHCSTFVDVCCVQFLSNCERRRKVSMSCSVAMFDFCSLIRYNYDVNRHRVFSYFIVITCVCVHSNAVVISTPPNGHVMLGTKTNRLRARSVFKIVIFYIFRPIHIEIL